MTVAPGAGPPLVIGGTGGSGTRIVTSLLAQTGRFMGANLNRFMDALDLAYFDWRWGLEYLRARMRGDDREVAGRMASEHDEAVRRHLRPLQTQPAESWGWKHPHSYLMLPFLQDRHPGLRFVHVVRDGRDIAFSSNQRQARRYGLAGLGERWNGPFPVRSAAYWAWANTLAQADGERLADRYLRLRFEDLCADPDRTVRRLLGFAEAEAATGPKGQAVIEELVAQVSPPASLGRWRRADRRLAAAVTEAARPALSRFGYLEQ